MQSKISPLISVVVPVYNVEKYLDRCIDSIVNQTYSNLEIILVDDGATDHSGEKCDEWALKDPRIQVVHKKNAGLGMARNTGLEHCTGKHVAFVDSDDFLAMDMFEKMLAAVEENHGDTCCCALCTYSNSQNKVIGKDVIQPGLYTGREALLGILGAEPESGMDWMLPMSACTSLYSLDVIKSEGILFRSEREYISEDFLFNIEYLRYADRVVLLENPYYYYCVNEKSLTHTYKPDRIEREVYLYEGITAMLEQIEQIRDDEYMLRFNKLFLGRVRAAIAQEATLSGNSVPVILKNIRRIAENPRVRAVISEYPYGRNPVKQRVFNFFLNHHLAIAMYLLVKLKK